MTGHLRASETRDSRW